ncbi:MAG: hypothetical protein JXN65_09520 [Clostridia bacterium]|nr:hypothetical protein [Clostridia bacterium]
MENLQNSGLVRFIARFINEETLGKWIGRIMYMIDTNSFRQQAVKLFVWAIIIIVLATIVDLIFYWSRPEQKIILMRYIANIQKRIDSRGRR